MLINWGAVWAIYAMLVVCFAFLIFMLLWLLLALTRGTAVYKGDLESAQKEMQRVAYYKEAKDLIDETLQKTLDNERGGLYAVGEEVESDGKE